MLAHLKAKNRERNQDGVASAPAAATTAAAEADDDITPQEEEEATQMTCDVLCSLGASYASPGANGMDDYSPESSINGSFSEGKRKGGKSCPKQHQLPMFLSKTYHMIDRCDSSIATWSSLGDNFVVKNVEKFASNVLPLYFKHSNFSSFARQLNFYGFRKLRTDPILTSDVDPRTACYVRFYHERFQKDRPELLHQIKRATKSDQQSKDDVESLKVEVVKLRDCISHMSGEMDRKLAEISYEYNRRITNMSGEYDKLAGLVQEILSHQQQSPIAIAAHSIHHPSADAPHIHPAAAQEAVVASAAAAMEAVPASRVPDLMQSLSQVAAMRLQNQLRTPAVPTTYSLVGAAAANGFVADAPAGGAKRCVPDEADVPAAGRARTS